MPPTTTPQIPSHFDLNERDAYERWRERKLKDHPTDLEGLIVEVQDPQRLTRTEKDTILGLCRRANMAIYAGSARAVSDKEIVRALGEQFGLTQIDHNMGADEDAITSIKVQSDNLHLGYIPYSNRPIAWHTDGYYNTPEHQIHGMLLHCVQPAAVGGENDLLDHEIAYILVRDRNPDFIRALMHPQAMGIPANIADGEELRPEQTGPVFSVRPDGRLHMRYTDRKRNIRWREDPVTQEALSYLREVLYQKTNWHFKGRLQPGWGLISNNVLHTRAAFEDGEQPRLLYRARYYDRIAGT